MLSKGKDILGVVQKPESMENLEVERFIWRSRSSWIRIRRMSSNGRFGAEIRG